MYLFKRNGVYYLAYRDESQKKEKRISTKHTKKKDAISFVIGFKEQMKNKPRLDYINLESFYKIYLQYIQNNYSATYAKQVNTTFKMFISAVGNIPIKEITFQQIEKFCYDTYKRTKEGARTYYIGLKSAFNKAITWNYLANNHFYKIKLPKIPKNNPLFIKSNEFKELLELENNLLLKDVYQFAFNTGLRLSEIVNLKWSEIDLAEGIIHIRNTEDFITKSKKERVIPVNSWTREILIRQKTKIISINNTDYVFTKNGFQMNGDYISKKFKKCVLQSNLNHKIHFHVLRHSFASNLVTKGISIFIIKELLGHSDVKTTQIYSHLRTEDLRSAIEALNDK